MILLLFGKGFAKAMAKHAIEVATKEGNPASKNRKREGTHGNSFR
jgi:hypothetical protein